MQGSKGLCIVGFSQCLDAKVLDAQKGRKENLTENVYQATNGRDRRIANKSSGTPAKYIGGKLRSPIGRKSKKISVYSFHKPQNECMSSFIRLVYIAGIALMTHVEMLCWRWD